MKINNWLKCKQPPNLVDHETIDTSMKELAQASRRFKNSEVMKKMGWGDNFEVFSDVKCTTNNL